MIMCDYSLEMYRNRKAEAGDRLVTTRFPTGSIGMTAQGDIACAVCIEEGTVLKMEGMPAVFRERHDFAEVEAATFFRSPHGIYRDSVRFENGVELVLQQFPVGVSVEIAGIPCIASDGRPTHMDEIVGDFV